MSEQQDFLKAYRKFVRPNLRGKLRRFWRWLNPPPPTYPTDSFRAGDIIWVNEEEVRVVSKTGYTLTLENGMTVTV